jgi:hypothetical protein
MNRVAFLGYVITEQGIEVDPAKIEAIGNWPQPKTVTQGHLLMNFYKCGPNQVYVGGMITNKRISPTSIDVRYHQ